MKALDFPIRFSNGGLKLTSNYDLIVRAQLIDTLMTNYRERIMRSSYGTDIQSFLFDTEDELRINDIANIIKERLIQLVPRAIIVDVRIVTDEAPLGVVYIDVDYKTDVDLENQTLRVPIPTAGNA
jgi:hypothetical protein